MKTFTALLILSFLLLSSISVLAQPTDEVCAMSTSLVTSTCQLAGLTLEEPITIPVVVHVITNSSGQVGNVSDAEIADQIDELNEAFVERDKIGTPLEIIFQFELVGVGRVRNSQWHTMQFRPDDVTQPEGQAKRALSVEPERVLNFYIANPNNNGDSAPYGWATFPFPYTFTPGGQT